MEPGESVHLSSSDLASGNSSKGLSAGLGDEGDDVAPGSRIRARDGILRLCPLDRRVLQAHERIRAYHRQQTG